MYTNDDYDGNLNIYIYIYIEILISLYTVHYPLSILYKHTNCICSVGLICKFNWYVYEINIQIFYIQRSGISFSKHYLRESMCLYTSCIRSSIWKFNLNSDVALYNTITD